MKISKKRNQYNHEYKPVKVIEDFKVDGMYVDTKEVIIKGRFDGMRWEMLLSQEEALDLSRKLLSWIR